MGKLDTKVSIVTARHEALDVPTRSGSPGRGKVAVADLDSYGGIAGDALPMGLDLYQ